MFLQSYSNIILDPFRRRRRIEARQLSERDCGYRSVRAFLNDGSSESFGIRTKSIYEGSKRGGAESVRGRETGTSVARRR